MSWSVDVPTIERLVRHAARIVGPDEAPDVTQEALIRCWRMGTTDLPLLHAVVRAACLDRLRARRRKPTVSIDRPGMHAHKQMRAWTDFEPPLELPPLTAREAALVRKVLETGRGGSGDGGLRWQVRRKLSRAGLTADVLRGVA